MPKARNPNLPQINAGQALYGEIPIELFPAGTSSTQENIGVGQLAFWDGVQWKMLKLVGRGGVDIILNAASQELEIYFAQNRTYKQLLADSILLSTPTVTFTSDAELV